MTAILENVPPSLQRLIRWVCWKLEERNGKKTKVPIDPHTGNLAKVNDSTTWASFGAAMEGYLRWGLSGVGFVFSKSDGYCGIDFDHCIDPATGEIDPIIVEYLSRIDSYTEISPSGSGVHVICKATLPPGPRRHNNIEMYDDGRFFTMTGNRWAGSAVSVEERQEEVTKFWLMIFSGKAKEESKEFSFESVDEIRGDDEVIAKACLGSRGEKFKRLWEGRWENWTYRSASDADMALCNYLALHSRNKKQVERLWLRSGMNRPKVSERADYRDRTILEAFHSLKSPDTYGEFERANGTITICAVGDAQRGLAEKFAERWKNYIRWNESRREWMRYLDFRWQGESDSYVIHAVGEFLKESIVEMGGRRGRLEGKALREYQQLCKSMLHYQFVNGIVNFLRATPCLSIREREFDQEPNLFCCRNGVYDLALGRIVSENSQSYLLRQSGVILDFEAKCPLFDQFLAEIFEDNPELIDYLWRIIGYSMTGHVDQQCWYFLHGIGMNGKSTLLHVLRVMLGDYCMQVDPATFEKLHGGRVRSDLARLAGARMVVCEELPFGATLDGTLLKQFTGGEPLTARFLFSKEFEFTPVGKLWVCANHIPRLDGSDFATWRRPQFIPFGYTVPKEKCNPHLASDLCEEIPGIFNKAAAKLGEYFLTKKIGIPGEVLEQIENFRRENDSIGSFLVEHCLISKTVRCRATLLYQAYEKYCQDNSEYTHSQTKFGRTLAELGYKKVVSGGVWRSGITLRGPHGDVAPF